jgi:hypothetical protein
VFFGNLHGVAPCLLPALTARDRQAEPCQTPEASGIPDFSLGATVQSCTAKETSMRTILALFACLGTPLAAETRQHGNVIFDIPKGWVLGGTREDGSLILRSDLPDDECEYCVIYITPGERAKGRADTWVSGQTRRFIDADETPEVSTMVEPEIANLKGRPAAMLGQKVDSDLQILFAIQLFGRMELIGFEASAYDEADVAEGMTVFQRDVLPMIEGTRFVSDGAPPLLPPPEPGPLTGLYWGFNTGWMMQLDGTMMMELYHRHLTFWPDGMFYDGTPPLGLLPPDTADLLADGDMEWGSYTVDGFRLTLTFASGAVEELALGEGKTLQNGDRTMYAVEPLADGSRIDGSLSSMFYTGFSPGSGISGGVSSSSLTSFNPDGTWSGDSSGGAFGNFESGGDLTGGFATSSENAVSGTYEVKSGLIIRSYEDGRPAIYDLIYRAGDDIYIGSETLGKTDQP